jgi:hypothetical protein
MFCVFQIARKLNFSFIYVCHLKNILIKIKWDKKCGLSLTTHQSYFNKFGNDFIDAILKLAKSYQDKRNSTVIFSDTDEKELLAEVFNHAYFCTEIVQKFQARNEVLQKVYKIFLFIDLINYFF